jgi:CheY-like chemotaxis protein
MDAWRRIVASFARSNRNRAVRHALVVVTDPKSRALCREVLKAGAFTVTTTDCGVGAVTAAREELPDVILIDMELRDGSGFEAIRWLRSNAALKSVPMVLMSANPEDASYLGSGGVNAVLRKPISAMAVRHTVRKVLKRTPA